MITLKSITFEFMRITLSDYYGMSCCHDRHENYICTQSLVEGNLTQISQLLRSTVPKIETYPDGTQKEMDIVGISLILQNNAMSLISKCDCRAGTILRRFGYKMKLFAENSCQG